MRVCDYVVKFLYDYGVRDIFMLSGGGIMYLTDGLAKFKDMNVVCFQHEQTMAMAVEAYAKAKGFGVGYVTTGPGTTNAITGLAGAWLDSVPCLFISGQASRDLSMYGNTNENVRQIGVQEIPIIPIVKSITKYAALVDKVKDAHYHLTQAVERANSGRPGPSWLDIPLDVQKANYCR